jgi:DNA-directed RNA polymerase specialized sigma subunit
MNDLSRYRCEDPSLDAAEERLLLRLAQADDARAKDKLVRHFHRLVLKIVAEFDGLDHDELIAVGMLGLLEAIGKFDLERDNRLSAFARHHVTLKVREEVKSWRRQGQTGESRADKFVYHNRDATIEEVMGAVHCTRKSAEEAIKRLSGYWNGFKPYDDADIDHDPGEVRRHARKKAEAEPGQQSA